MIYTLFLFIWLDSNTIHVADKTYHESVEECNQYANIIIREYVLENGPLRIFKYCDVSFGI